MTTTEKNITDQLSDMCKAVGSNLGAVCTELKIQRPVLERWKWKTPTGIEKYLAAQDKAAYIAGLPHKPRSLEIYLAITQWCNDNTPRK